MQTICPGCQTTFRISADQLRAKDGRVRCGVCHNAFSALHALIDEPSSEEATPVHQNAAVVNSPALLPPPSLFDDTQQDKRRPSSSTTWSAIERLLRLVIDRFWLTHPHWVGTALLIGVLSALALFQFLVVAHHSPHRVYDSVLLASPATQPWGVRYGHRLCALLDCPSGKNGQLFWEIVSAQWSEVSGYPTLRRIDFNLRPSGNGAGAIPQNWPTLELKVGSELHHRNFQSIWLPEDYLPSSSDLSSSLNLDEPWVVWVALPSDLAQSSPSFSLQIH